MTTRIIRPVRTEDRAVWEELFLAYGKFYKLDISAEARETVWNWIFDEQNDFWCSVLEEADGALSGLVQYQLMHRSLGGSMTCYLSDLYVNPDIRGGGGGRALIDYVRAFAEERGLASVRWLTEETNYTARQLYDTYQPKTNFVFYSIPPQTN